MGDFHREPVCINMPTVSTLLSYQSKRLRKSVGLIGYFFARAVRVSSLMVT